MDVAKLDYSIGRILVYQAKYKQAEEKLKKALAIYTREKGEDDIEVSQVLNRLGALYSEVNKLEEAESCFLKSLRYLKYIMFNTLEFESRSWELQTLVLVKLSNTC